VVGTTTVFPPLIESEFELTLKLWVGNVTVLPPVIESDPLDTLSEGLGTLTVKLLADVVTEAAPVPTPLTEALGKITVLPLLMVSELEETSRLWVGRATVLPFVIDIEPFDTLNEGLGTLTVKLLADVVTEAAPVPTPLTEAPGKITVLPLLMVSELDVMPRLWVGRATVLPFAIDNEPFDRLSEGLGTLTVKVVPVVGETVAIPMPVI
jgi:hypothetical protein